MMSVAGPPGGYWRFLEGADPLAERRIVFVTGRLDDGLAARAAAALLSLDAAGAAPIDVHVDSPDGTLEAAFALIDTLALLRAPVRALCRGVLAAPAIGVVAGAGHRAALPHARFRLAQPTVRFVGAPTVLDAARREHRDRLVTFQVHLARATGRPVDEIADDMRRGRELDARGALAYGLIDTIRDASG